MDPITLAKLVGKPPQELADRVNSKIEECRIRLESHYPRETFPLPTISYDLKGGVGGRAYYGHNHIQVNLEMLLNPAHTEEMINVTIPHEYAHLASYRILPTDAGRGHGSHWKYIMNLLGLPAKRCHHMEFTPAKKTQKFAYTCNCPGRIHMIGLNRHRKMENGIMGYYCRSCGAGIQRSPE